MRERLARFQREAEVARLAESSEHRAIHGLEKTRRHHALVMELVEGDDAGGPHRARRDPVRRGAADREANRRGARSRARAGHHPSRSEAREHQGAAGRHGEGARLRPGEGDGARRFDSPSVSQSPTITTPAMTTCRDDPRHRGVHVAGAGAREDRRQARGHLGVWRVLFEMLTGQRAFPARISRTRSRRS